MNRKQEEPLIVVEHLQKIYGEGSSATPALRGASLSVVEGEFLALMGPSGCGKSTLLHILAFLDFPTAGTYHFAGRNTMVFNEKERARIRNAAIGFVFQQFFLLPRTTALDQVRLPLQYARISSREQKRRASSTLCAMGLENRLTHRPNELSGGEQQRVAIARALVHEPRILFCDEPTGNLDSQSSKEVLEIIQRLNRSGKTIIMVTHAEEVAAAASRVIRMKDGIIL